jgi:hypothetical protein
MSTIFALAGMSASDYQFVNQAGQSIIYEAAQRYMREINDDVLNTMSVFVSGTTEDHTERYKLPGAGRLMRRADGVRGVASRALGSWDTAYPLYDYAEQVAATDIEMAYMTPAEFQLHVDGVVNRYVTEIRHSILHALLDNAPGSYEDPKWGTLTLVPLAGGAGGLGSVTYPPVLGSAAEATEDHYLESGYAAASISDANNPFVTIRNELEEHFGTPQGFGNIAVFVHTDEVPEVENLSDFDSVEDINIRSGANRDVPTNIPNLPGRVIGRTNGCWVSEWRWLPTAYMLGIDLDVEPPLKMRVDPAATGLPRGLALVARDDGYPIESAEWRARFGISVANRLNGVAFELGTGGTYSVPAAYT